MSKLNPFGNPTAGDARVARIHDELRRESLREKSLKKQDLLPTLTRRKTDPTYQMGDMAASLFAGFSALLEGAGTVQGAVTGDMDNWLRNTGQDNREFYNERKSLSLQNNEEYRSQRVQEADGVLGQAKAAIWATIDDPDLFASFMLEQLPNLAAGGAIGKGVGGVAKGVNAARGLTGEAALKAATTAAGRGGVTGSSALHGADVASGAYDGLMHLDDGVWDLNPEFKKLERIVGRDEAKKQIATNKTRAALGTATLASLLTQKLPGGDVLEKTLSGAAKGIPGKGLVTSAVLGGAGEGVQEVIEEGTGNVIGNAAVASVDPTQELTEGLGESIGLGLLGGVTTGGGLGAVTGAANDLADANVPSADPSQVQVNPKLSKEKVKAKLPEVFKEGDVSSLLSTEDPESFSPVTAMGTNMSMASDTATSQEKGEDAKYSPETIQKNTKAIIKAQEDHIAGLEKAVAEATDDKVKQELQDDLTIAGNEMKQILHAEQQINQAGLNKEAPAQEEKEQLIEKLEEAETAEDVPEEKERVLKLAMRNPDAFSDEELYRIGESNSLDNEQRAYVESIEQTRRAVAEVESVLENGGKTLSQVHSEVLSGGEGFAGISQYLQKISLGITDGDTNSANEQLSKLEAFQSNREAKLKVFQDAYNQVQESGRPVFLEPNEKGEWSVNPDKLPRKKDKHNGFVMWHTDTGKVQSEKVVGVIEAEGKAVGAAVSQAQSLFALEGKPVESAPTTSTPVSEPAPTEAAPQVQAEVEQTAPVETLQERTTAAIEESSKGTTAEKWTPKELAKSRQATQFIGEGPSNSSTSRYAAVYEKEGASNTGEYTADDVVFVASNGKRKGAVTPVINGELQGAYKNIDKAIAAGAKIVMDTKAHLDKTQNYNVGESALASYMESKGYTRDDSSGAGVWSPQTVAQKPKDTTAQKPSEPNTPTQSAQSAAEKSTEPAKSAQKSAEPSTTEQADKPAEQPKAPVKAAPPTDEELAAFDTALDSNETQDDISRAENEAEAEIEPDFDDDITKTIIDRVLDNDGETGEVVYLGMPVDEDALIKHPEIDVYEITHNGMPMSVATQYGSMLSKKLGNRVKKEGIPELSKEELKQITGENLVVPKRPQDPSTVKNVGAVVTDGDTDQAANETEEKEQKRSGNLTLEELGTANLIKEYFTRKTGSDTSKSLNPLTRIKDFISKLVNPETGINEELLAEYISGVRTEDQNRTLRTFLEFHKAFVPEMRKQLEFAAKAKTATFWYEDPALFLTVDDERNSTDIAENDLTAMALSAYTYLAENAKDMDAPTDAALKNLFGIDEKGYMSPEQMEYARKLVKRKEHVTADLGKRATSAMGLKAVRGAPRDTQPNMEGSVGAHILAALVSIDYLADIEETNPLLIAHVADEKVREGYYRDNGEIRSQSFVNLRTQTGGGYANGVTRIVAANQKTQGFFAKLFSIEGAKRLPATEPGSNNQKIVKNGLTRIPSEQKKNLDNYADRPWAPVARMATLANAISHEGNMAIAGVVRITEERPVLRRHEKSVTAKNNAIIRGMDNFWGWYSQAEDKTFYLTPSVAKQQRVHHEGIIDPQTDKYIRHMVNLKESSKTLTKGSIDDKTFRLFQLGVAQGLGIDTDKEFQEDSLNALANIRKEEVFQKAVAAINAAMTVEPNPDGTPGVLPAEQEQAIIDAVNLYGEKQHTLAALSAWAQYESMQAGESFDTDIMYEVDGQNNGPAFAQIFLGTISAIGAGAFGFYTKGGEQSTPGRAANGKYDMYESAFLSLKGQIASLDPSPEKSANAILSIMGAGDADPKNMKNGRSFMKEPLVPLIFGSGRATSVKAMAAGFLKSFYLKYEKALQDGDTALADSLIDNMNAVVDPEGINTKPFIKYPRNPWNFTLGSQQEAVVIGVFENSLGKAAKGVIADQYQDFTNLRNDLNEAAQATWARYDAAYTFLYNKFSEEEAGVPRKSFKRDGVTEVRALQALSPKKVKLIEDILRPLQPTIHTAMSKQSKDISSGMYLGKTKFRSAAGTSDAQAFTTASKTNKTPVISIGDNNEQVVSRRSSNYKSVGSRITLENPGAAPVIGGTHSSDSAVAVTTYGEIPALNVHDALILGLDHILSGAEKLNENTFKVLSDYSIPLEITSALKRSFQAEADLAKQYPGLGEVLANVEIDVKEWNGQELEDAKKKIDRDALREVTQKAYDAELRKLRMFKDIDSIGQYGLPPINANSTEGSGNYTLTAEDIAKLDQRIVQLEAQMTQKGYTVAGRPQAAPQGAPKQVEAAPTATTKPVPTPVNEPVTKEQIDTEWGSVGKDEKSTLQSDLGLVNIIKEAAKRGVPATSLMFSASNYIGSKDKFISTLLGALGKSVKRPKGKEIGVKYITPKTEFDPADKDMKTARAWYSVGPKGEYIAIKSPDFTYSGVTGEALAHEMTHAALSASIQDWLDGSKMDPEVAAAVSDLNDLYLIVKDHLDKAGKSDKFALAMTDLHEFASWGMTNTELQTEMGQIEVQGDIVTRTDGRFEQLATAMKKFVKTLVDIVLPARKAKPEVRTALELTIHNAMSLMGQSAPPVGEAASARRHKMETKKPSDYTSAEVLDGLGKNSTVTHSTERMQHLHNMMNKVVYAVYGAEGPIKSTISDNTPSTPEEVYLHAKASGHTPFASLVSPQLSLSAQEEFVLESLEVTIRGALHNSAARRKELIAIFNRAKASKAVKAGLTKDEFDAIFSVTNAKGDSADYLSRFAAAGMVHEPLNNLLQQEFNPIDTQTRRGKNLAESVKHFLDKAVALLNRILSRTYRGQAASESIQRMVIDVATLENKRNRRLDKQKQGTRSFIEDTTSNLADSARKGVVKALDSNVAKKVAVGPLNVVRRGARVVAAEEIDTVVNKIETVSDWLTTGRMNLGMEMINDIRGENPKNTWRFNLLDFADKVEQEVMRVMRDTGKLVNDSWGRELTDEESSAVTNVFLRSDMQHLYGDFYSMAQLENMLTDPKLLANEIQNHVATLKGNARKSDINYYMNAAKGLGYYMATNKTSIPNLQKNAHNIAFKANTRSKLKRADTAYGDAMVTALDPLISLYALQQMDKTEKHLAAKVMREEMGRGEQNGNGVDAVLRLHRDMQQRSKSDLFDGKAVSMSKGYVKEITDPYVNVVSEDAAKHDEMIEAGFELVGPLKKAKNDFTPEKRNLYKIADQPLVDTVTGFTSTTSKKSKGYSVNTGAQVDMLTGEVNPFGKLMNRKSTAHVADQIDAMFKTNGDTFNPANVRETFTSPILNHRGEAINYRYEMDMETRDKLLNPNNRIDKVMGNIAGSMLNKKESLFTNHKAVDALHAEYQQKFLSEPNSFVEFGPESPDPDIRDRYFTLPAETRAYMQQKFGSKTIKVHNKTYNMAFGYRKYALSSIFDKLPEQRNAVEASFVYLAERIPVGIKDGKVQRLGKRAALRMAQGGVMWDEGVKFIKDALVIKNLTTLLGNETSNGSILIARGIPIDYIAKKKVEAYGFTMDYIRNASERFHLQRQLEIGVNQVLGTDKEPMSAELARQKVQQLNVELANSPVKGLMDQGQFHTLVEELDQEADEYSYRNKLARWSDEKTANVPPWIKATGKQLIMSHDTTLYKVLNSATMYSDFTSRYVMYEWLTKESNEGLTPEDAMREARQAFIAYNVPSPKGIQYASDKGLIWYPKYYMRFQVVAAQLIKRNPARALAIYGLGDVVFNIADFIDSTVLSRWPINLGAGALEAGNAVGEILPVKVLKGITGIGDG